MPTYEYKCPAGHLFEKFFPTMHDKRREKCPVCGRQAERQISGGAGLVFKGSGFYITDYKRAGEKQPEGNEEPKPLPESKPTVESKTPEGTKSKKKDRKSTRLNSSHPSISYAVFCLKKKKNSCKKTENVKVNNSI